MLLIDGKPPCSTVSAASIATNKRYIICLLRTIQHPLEMPIVATIVGQDAKWMCYELAIGGSIVKNLHPSWETRPGFGVGVFWCRLPPAALPLYFTCASIMDSSLGASSSGEPYSSNHRLLVESSPPRCFFALLVGTHLVVVPLRGKHGKKIIFYDETNTEAMDTTRLLCRNLSDVGFGDQVARPPSLVYLSNR
jgi:hypothetical protein